MKYLVVIIIFSILAGCAPKSISERAESTDAVYFELAKGITKSSLLDCISTGDTFEMYIDRFYLHDAFDWYFANWADGDIEPLNGKFKNNNEVSVKFILMQRAIGTMNSTVLATKDILFENGIHKRTDPNSDEPLIYAGTLETRGDLTLKVRVIENDENTKEQLDEFKKLLDRALETTGVTQAVNSNDRLSLLTDVIENGLLGIISQSELIINHTTPLYMCRSFRRNDYGDEKKRQLRDGYLYIIRAKGGVDAEILWNDAVDEDDLTKKEASFIKIRIAKR